MLAYAAGAAAALGFLAFALRRKLRRDAIYQGGVRVGSALPPLLAPDGKRARFAVLRGEPGFREGEPFVNRGMAFRIVSAGNYDDRSTVLRRWLDATCEVIGPP